ncbi:MAG: hypothetical protein OHK0015_21320 [Chloroflexi bacterium OHK40]
MEGHSPRVNEASRHNPFERFLPALRNQPGFVAGSWGKAPDGRAVSITVRESEDALPQSTMNANAVPLLPGQEPALIAAPSSMDRFARCAWARKQPAASGDADT